MTNFIELEQPSLEKDLQAKYIWEILKQKQSSYSQSYNKITLKTLLKNPWNNFSEIKKKCCLVQRSCLLSWLKTCECILVFYQLFVNVHVRRYLVIILQDKHTLAFKSAFPLYA